MPGSQDPTALRFFCLYGGWPHLRRGIHHLREALIEVIKCLPSWGRNVSHNTKWIKCPGVTQRTAQFEKATHSCIMTNISLRTVIIYLISLRIFKDLGRITSVMTSLISLSMLLSIVSNTKLARRFQLLPYITGN